MKIDCHITGGCHGHYGEDDRCYCDSADFHFYFFCTTKKCKGNIVNPPFFGDQYSVVRWFNENMNTLSVSKVFPCI